MVRHLESLVGLLIAVAFFGGISFFNWHTQHWIAFAFSSVSGTAAVWYLIRETLQNIEPKPAFTGHYRNDLRSPSPMPIGVRIVTIACWTGFAIQMLFFHATYVDRWSIGAREVLIRHEWWRFITSVFVHAGGWHIMTNMAALAACGGWIERLLGPRRFAIIFAAAALGGGLAVVAFGQERTVGASGAIYGFIGALLALALMARRGGFEREARSYFKSGAMILALNLFFTLSIPFISLAAHCGGALFGFAATLALGIPAGLHEVWTLTKAFPGSTRFVYEGGREFITYHGPARYALEAGFATLEDWVSAVKDDTLPPYAPLRELDLDHVSLECTVPLETLKTRVRENTQEAFDRSMPCAYARR
jgi:membrane associated rhomboid family serine protease